MAHQPQSVPDGLTGLAGLLIPLGFQLPFTLKKLEWML